MYKKRTYRRAPIVSSASKPSPVGKGNRVAVDEGMQAAGTALCNV